MVKILQPKGGCQKHMKNTTKSYHSILEKPSSQAISEWTHGSSIDSGLAEANLSSTQYGIWEVFAVDLNTGARVNRGQRKTGKDKPKYVSFPRRRETDALPLALTEQVIVKCLCGVDPELYVEFREHYYNTVCADLGFYRFLLGHPEIPIYVTEGVKKAACLLTHGYVGIALPGVWNAQTDGGSGLKPVISELCTGRQVYLVFDSDFHTKPQVWSALQNLAYLISNNGSKEADNLPECKIVVWDESLGKGVDDLVVQGGFSKLRTAITKALTLAQWERQFPKPEGFGGSAKGKLNAVVIGSEIAEDYRDSWVWNSDAQEWMQYRDERGLWESVHSDVIESQIDSIIKARGITAHSGNSFISNILGQMKRTLTVSPWNERTDLLPFTNCCVSIETGEVVEHSPGHRLTWCLPREYNPLATNWDKISEWLDFVSDGDIHKRDILIHFAAATLRGRYDLQKFIHLIGHGGTGKSTYTNLLTALIGDKNVAYLTLPQLNEKHSLIEIQFKRLLVLADQESAPKNVSNFKNITGGDKVSDRHLHKGIVHFVFKGMVALTSNYPIFKADIGTWLTRRQMVLHLNKQPKGRRDLMREFEGELGAFTQYLLSIPNEQIDAALSASKGSTVSWEAWESMMTDSVVAFVEENVIYEPGNRMAAGDDQNEWSSVDYNPFTSTLYGAYAWYTKRRGQTILNSQNFRTRLEEVCKMIPGWEDIERPNKTIRVNGKPTRGFVGIRLRQPADSTNHPSEILMEGVTSPGLLRNSDRNSPQPLQDGSVTGVTPKLQDFSENKNHDQPWLAKPKILESLENGVTGVSPVTVGVVGVTQGVTSGVTSSKKLKCEVGDIVRYVGSSEVLQKHLPDVHKVLIVERMDGCLRATLELPHGGFSPWIPFSDLKLADS